MTELRAGEQTAWGPAQGAAGGSDGLDEKPGRPLCGSVRGRGRREVLRAAVRSGGPR